MGNGLPATEETRNDFLRRYGGAMAAWATIERELSTLFALVTKMNPALATQLFYSSRSFNGRADMFKAALFACEASEAVKTLSRAILKKAVTYNTTRASLAHDLPNYDYKGGIVLVQGRAQFQSDEMKEFYSETNITMDDLSIISSHFDRLATLIHDFWEALVLSKAPSLDRVCKQLLLLPTDPRAKDQSPHDAPHSPPPSAFGG
jgi:hypothetical protein